MVLFFSAVVLVSGAFAIYCGYGCCWWPAVVFWVLYFMVQFFVCSGVFGFWVVWASGLFCWVSVLSGVV